MVQTKKVRKRPTKKSVPEKKAELFAVQPIAISKKSKRGLWLSLIIIVMMVTAIGVLSWQVVKARKELHKYKDPQKAVQAAGEELTTEVGKVMILPQGETPTLANVTDAQKLKDKPFFTNAHNGDKVLIYSQAKKAILYRPSTKQIVEVAAYDPAAQATPQPTQ